MAKSQLTRNYLHFGNSLDELVPPTPESLSPHSLKVMEYAEDRSIDVSSFESLILKSIKSRDTFSKLGVRGFSYSVNTDFLFSYPLREEIDFKLAVCAEKDLFYPPRVYNHVMRAKRRNHVVSRKYKAIAFALGRMYKGSLYLFVMQSDLLNKTPSFVRDHFKGWRRVLFAEVVMAASRLRCESLHLADPDDVLRTCVAPYYIPPVLPTSWKAIYSATAHDFGMIKTECDLIDIQALRGGQAVVVNSMYLGNVKQLVGRIR